MSNDKAQMSNQAQNPNDKKIIFGILAFGLSKVTNPSHFPQIIGHVLICDNLLSLFHHPYELIKQIV